MTIAVYPGSFDPVTLGHLDVIARTARIFDEVRVCVMKNVSKHYCFDESERLALLAESTQALANGATGQPSFLRLGAQWTWKRSPIRCTRKLIEIGRASCRERV